MAVGIERARELNPLLAPNGADRFAYQVHLIESDEDVLASASTDPNLPAVFISPVGGPDVDVPFVWTLDGTSVLYRTVIGSRELYVAPSDASAAPLRLHPGPVRAFGPTASGGRALVLASSALSYSSLYSVPLDGSTAPVLLSGTLNVGSFFPFSAFKSSPTGRCVFTTVDLRLYSAPEDGSAPPILLSTGAVDTASGWPIDATGARVVYLQGNRLWSAVIDGSAPPVELNPALPAFAAVTDFELGAVNKVVYRVDVRTDGRFELFRSRVDGTVIGQPIFVVPVGGTVASPFKMSPDGTRVVCNARTGSPLSTRLFSVAVDGSGSAELIAAEIEMDDLQVTPDSAFVVCLRSAGGYHLASVPLAGGTVQSLTPVISSLGKFVASPSHVVFTADDPPGSSQLYRVPVDPGGPPPAPTQLNVLLGPVDDTTFPIVDDGFVLFSAIASGGAELKVHRAELNGPPDPRPFLTPPVTRQLGDAEDLRATLDRVVYVADQETVDQNELFSVPADGSSPPVKVSGTFIPEGGIPASFGRTPIELSPDGTLVGFLADAEVDGRIEAYVAPTDGSSGPVKLNPPLTAGTSVNWLTLSPDGSRFFYVADLQASPGQQLCSVPASGGTTTTLGSTPVTFINAPYSIAPDSSRVVFLSTRIYSTPLAGGALTDLSGHLQSPGAGIQITPDSAHVLFTATLGSGYGLFSNSLSGGALLRLSGSFTSSSLVGFSSSSDGTRALFVALVSGYRKLYSVPVAGGPLVAMHAATFDLLSYTTSGAHVLFHIEDQNFPYRDSWVVSELDGSNPITLPLASQYFLSPDGETVLYSTGGVLQAMSSNGGPALTLSGGFVSPIAFTPDGSKLAFAAFDSGIRMVPLAGGPDLQLVSPASNPQSLHFNLLRRDRWVYLGAKNDPETVELYGGMLVR
jgi:Tol biopolymer transport system component